MRPVVLRNLSRLFALATLALAAIAGYKWFAPAATPGRLAVDRTALDLGTLPQGEHRVVIARVTNSGGQPASVVGMGDSCGHGGCYSALHNGPMTVPAGETVDVACRVELRDQGPFHFEVPLYLDNGKLEQVTIDVTGVVLPGERGTGTNGKKHP